MRFSVAVAVACLSVAGFSAADSVDAAVRKTTNIPAQGLGPALQALAKDRGFQIVYVSDEVNSLRTQGATGELTREEALTQLLNGTGLTYRSFGDNAVSVVAVGASTSLSAGIEPIAFAGEAGHEVKEAGGGFRRLRLAQNDQPLRSDAPSERQVSENSSENSQRVVFLEEIIVTATKREERMVDIPVSIAVISSQDIERRGLIGMEDYLRSIPGVSQIDNGPISNAIVIRGITTSPEFENISSGSTVASYFGETPITAAAGIGQGGIDVRPVDIERIEVLRGPQGTAYGSASLGGAMRMIPAKPDLDDFSARFSAAYSDTSGDGSENSMIQGVVNLPLVADKFAIRGVGYRYDESGFYRNTAGINPGMVAIFENVGLGDLVRGDVQEDVGQAVSVGGRLAASWQVTDKLDLSLTFLTQKIEQDGAPEATIGKYEQVRAPVAAEGRVRGEAGEIQDTELDLVNLVLNYDFGWADLTSAISSVDGGSVWARDLSGLFQLPASATAPSDFESFTAETRLASQLEGRFQFLGGVFYEDVEDAFLQLTVWPGTPETSPFGTDPMGISNRARQLDQRAVFGEASYDLTDKLTATLGGRYFEYDKSERALQEGGLFGAPIGGGVTRILENGEDGSSFKGNLTYKPTADSLLYASWAEGFRLGRPATGLPSAVCDTDGDGLVDGASISIESTRTIESDFLESYEIGGKATLFDRRLVVDASVYHIEWDGLPIFTSATCGNTIQSYTANVGAATSDGMEFQASLSVLEGLRLDFGAGYTKAELSKDAPSLGAQEGSRLPGSPEVSANLAAQYDFEFGGHRAFLRADSFYAGKFYSNLQETPGAMAGDYIKVDARAGVAIRNVSIELFVRNLTDEDAFTWRSTNPFLGSYRLRPRTVGMQLGYSFD